MAFCDYIHCDRCVAIHEVAAQEMRDGKRTDWPDVPGYKMLYVGDSEIREGAGMPAIFCERHYTEHLDDCRMTMIRAVVAAQWAVACVIDTQVTREANEIVGDCSAVHYHAERVMDEVAALPTAEQIVDGVT